MTTEELIKALIESKTPVEAPKKKKRKRGGLAGIYDRNKKWIKAGATGLAGALSGGVLAPALIGGAIGGLDREGKGGIGFDLGGAAKGAASGAATGMLGAGIKGGMGGGGWSGAKEAMGKYASGIPGMGGVGEAISGAGAGAGGAKGGGIMAALNKYATPVGMGLQGAAGVMGAQSERAIAERRLRMEQEERERLQRERDQRAALLAPLYRDVMNRSGYGGR